MNAAPYTITCDHPACPATLTATTCASVERAARQAGWLTSPAIHACPQHWNVQVQDQPA